MSVTHIVGIDPGLVHTGVVSMTFLPDTRHILVRSYAITGATPAEHAHNAATMVGSIGVTTYSGPVKPHVYIEGYRPRSNLNSDARMTATVNDIKRNLPHATVLLNTGVKKVVKKPLMELLGVWSFTTTTHHQDLRSAARIALLGMLKQEPTNRLLSDVVRDHLKGRDWHVAH